MNEKIRKVEKKCDIAFLGEVVCFNMEETQVLFHGNRKKP